MIPANPLASYFADGLLIISILSILDAGMLPNPFWLPKPVRLDCFPSIKTTTLSLPRKITFPSWSKVTPGMVFMASKTEPPDCAILLSRLKDFLLRSELVVASVPVTSTSSKASKEGASPTLPRSKTVFSPPANNVCCVPEYPINEK